ncbi:MAG: hypothetical protein R8P61_15990 [Bacteroidia bacterium]|nr:hypothetical protein [Bacteroidia bacterium]
MNSERIILANFENIHEANHFANLLLTEGINCEVIKEESLPGFLKHASLLQAFQIRISPEDEFMARVILQTQDPWFMPQVQTPIGQQYRLIGAIITFVGFLCAFLSLGGPNIQWVWIPLCLAIGGLFLFITGIKKTAAEEKEELSRHQDS